MDEETFLSALRESPADEVTWSALADWLEESGQGERAELVRSLRRLRATVGERTTQREALAARVAGLMASGVRPVLVGFTNTIGMRFVLVEPGTFLMGSPPHEAGRGVEEHQHEVTITRPYYLGVHPVTQGEWKAVMGSSPSHFCRSKGAKDRVKDISDADLAQFPVECVSWEDAQAFLKELAAMKEEAKSGREYRLPSEAEWEYACRGGHLNLDRHKAQLPFHFQTSTDKLTSKLANFDGNYPNNTTDSDPVYLERPTKVGSYEANLLGLSDMHGNVCEWCQDWYDQYYYERGDGRDRDPPGPPEGPLHMYRGGSWYGNGQGCRSAYRDYSTPGYRSSHVGFRAAVVPSSR